MIPTMTQAENFPPLCSPQHQNHTSSVPNRNNTISENVVVDREHREEAASTLMESTNSLIQDTLNSAYSNLPYGDSIEQPKEATTLRLYFQNIRGIANARSWQTCEYAAQQLRHMEVDICGFAETNITGITPMSIQLHKFSNSGILTKWR
jgi:hypothetical protein